MDGIRVITVLERDPIGGYEFVCPLTTSAERDFENTDEFFEWIFKRYDVFEIVGSDEQEEGGLRDYEWCIYRYITNYQHENKETNQEPYEVRILTKVVAR